MTYLYRSKYAIQFSNVPFCYPRLPFSDARQSRRWEERRRNAGQRHGGQEPEPDGTRVAGLTLESIPIFFLKESEEQHLVAPGLRATSQWNMLIFCELIVTTKYWNAFLIIWSFQPLLKAGWLLGAFFWSPFSIDTNHDELPLRTNVAISQQASE